jgi:hypothetical protein
MSISSGVANWPIGVESLADQMADSSLHVEKSPNHDRIYAADDMHTNTKHIWYDSIHVLEFKKKNIRLLMSSYSFRTFFVLMII